MICTQDDDKAMTVTEFALYEEFSTELLSRHDPGVLDIVEGHVKVMAVNGTWWYEIDSFPNAHCVGAYLVRYER